MKALVYHGPANKAWETVPTPQLQQPTDVVVQIDTTTTSLLLKLVGQGKLQPDQFVTHRFKLDDMMEAYDSFGRAAETKAIKVAISR